MDVKYKYTSGKNRNFGRIFGNRNSKLIVILIVLSLGIGPLIADQIVGSGQSETNSDTSTVQAPIEPSESLSPSPSESNSPMGNADESSTVTSAESEPKISASPIKEPPHAVANQEMLIQIPRVLKRDPRAKTANLPIVNFASYGSPYLMLCINSSRGLIDVEAKGIDDTFSGEDIFINNDRSLGVQISGVSSQVLNIFNSFGGLRVSSLDGRSIVGTYLYMRFVAISEPTDNFTLCSEAKSSGIWGLEIQPIGLQVGTKKNPLSLGNK